MIGRRLAQSLALQNWTAISIEFVLLVAGVFLGIQAANWNQEREARSKAAIFTVRLQEDMRHELWGEQVLIEYYSGARKHAELALQALSGKHPLSDEQWLISAYRATQYRTLSRRRATHDELVSTGTIGLITDARLREVAVSFFLSDLYETTAQKGPGVGISPPVPRIASVRRAERPAATMRGPRCRCAGLCRTRAPAGL